MQEIQIKERKWKFQNVDTLIDLKKTLIQKIRHLDKDVRKLNKEERYLNEQIKEARQDITFKLRNGSTVFTVIGYEDGLEIRPSCFASDNLFSVTQVRELAEYINDWLRHIDSTRALSLDEEIKRVNINLEIWCQDYMNAKHPWAHLQTIIDDAKLNSDEAFMTISYVVFCKLYPKCDHRWYLNRTPSQSCTTLFAYDVHNFDKNDDESIVFRMERKSEND